MSHAPPIDREQGLHLLHQMLRIRRFEERCAELYTQEKIRGFLHLYIGEEAVAAGVFQALHEDDPVYGTYREHAHALLRGVDAGAIMAEMYGKWEGCALGRGGSMHLFDVAKAFYGGNAIVGGHLPMAVGTAFAHKELGKRTVTACFFGEGAVAEGEFHESLNLAQLWRAPVLFCCENNGYAMGTALDRSESQTSIVVKANSYGVAAEVVDGMDVLEVARAARAAVAAVRESQRPFLLELRTYRFRAHSMFDPQLYRSREEVAEMRDHHDPIHTLAARLAAWGLFEEGDLDGIEELVRGEVDAAVAFAEAGTWEPLEDLTKHVLAEGGAA